jgi:PIN domain nuclease of toxin-antitoxin system
MIVLDSSAVLAVALQEPGAAAVHAELSDAVLSTANLAEILTVAERNGFDSDEIFRLIADLGVPLVPVGVQHARIAAKLWSAGRRLNLSLGDRICLALALEQNATVLTSDREMARLQAGISVRLFR